jgi:hypothetical protein
MTQLFGFIEVITQFHSKKEPNLTKVVANVTVFGSESTEITGLSDTKKNKLINLRYFVLNAFINPRSVHHVVINPKTVSYVIRI